MNNNQDSWLVKQCKECKQHFCKKLTENSDNLINFQHTSTNYSNISLCNRCNESKKQLCGTCDIKEKIKSKEQTEELNVLSKRFFPPIKRNRIFSNNIQAEDRKFLTKEVKIEEGLKDKINIPIEQSKIQKEIKKEDPKEKYNRLKPHFPLFTNAEKYIKYYMKYEKEEVEKEREDKTQKIERVMVTFKRIRYGFFEVELMLDSKIPTRDMKHLLITIVGDELELSAKIYEITLTCDKNRYRGECRCKRLNSFVIDQSSICCNIQNELLNDKFHRIIEASKNFGNGDKIDGQIRNLIIQPQNKKFPKLDRTISYQEINERLEMKQIESVKTVLENKVTLIQGPPGTGKTHVLTKIVEQLVNQDKRILVVAESNNAVINATLKMHKAGIKIVRHISFTKCFEEIKAGKTELYNITTIQLVFKAMGIEEKDFKDKISELLLGQSEEIKDDLIEISVDESKEKSYDLKTKEGRRSFQEVFDEKFIEVIKKYKVVCSTCIGAGNKLLDEIEFPIVIVDEAGQVTEPSLLVPLTKGCNHLVLIGDHKQLPPYVGVEKNKKTGFGVSLFERVSFFIDPILLDVQFRAHPEIAKLYSNLFYEGRVKTAQNREESLPEIDKLFNNGPPICFIDHNTNEKRVEESYCNHRERDICIELVEVLKRIGIKDEQIGIISPYNGQKTLLISTKKFSRDIEIGNVDSFQGREKDVIIFSCVRSNYRGEIGFMNSSNRLNVAISRAKHALFVIGDKSNFKTQMWKKFIEMFNNSDRIFRDMNDFKIKMKFQYSLQQLLTETKCCYLSKISNYSKSNFKECSDKYVSQYISSCIRNFDATKDQEAFNKLYKTILDLNIMGSWNLSEIVKFLTILIEIKCTISIEILIALCKHKVNQSNMDILFNFLIFLLYKEMFEQYNKIVEDFQINIEKLYNYLIKKLLEENDLYRMQLFIKYCKDIIEIPENNQSLLDRIEELSSQFYNTNKKHYDNKFNKLIAYKEEDVRKYLMLLNKNKEDYVYMDYISNGSSSISLNGVLTFTYKGTIVIFDLVKCNAASSIFINKKLVQAINRELSNIFKVNTVAYWNNSKENSFYNLFSKYEYFKEAKNIYKLVNKIDKADSVENFFNFAKLPKFNPISKSLLSIRETELDKNQIEYLCTRSNYMFKSIEYTIDHYDFILKDPDFSRSTTDEDKTSPKDVEFLTPMSFNPGERKNEASSSKSGAININVQPILPQTIYNELHSKYTFYLDFYLNCWY